MLIRDVETFVLKVRGPAAYLGALPDGTELTADAGYRVREPWRSLYSASFETLLVRVEAEDGTAGWGEALAPVGPEIPAEIVDRLLGPQLIGSDAAAPRPAWARLRALMRERGHLVGHQADALAALDIALWDLAGRISGLSVARLLGGAHRDRVPAYVSGLPRPDDAGRAELARAWQEKGARTVKLHLGYGVDTDLATVDAVRAAAPDLDVAVDAHWRYGPAQAARLGRELADRGVVFLEAPLAPEDVDAHRRLADRIELPIAIGETLRTRYEFAQWLAAGAIGLAQPDVGRTGITEATAIAELCAAHHVPLAPHHSVALGPALAAGLHVSAATEDSPFFEYQPTTVETAAALGFAFDVGPDGFGLDERPGLGLDVDEDRIRATATRHHACAR
ncbi:mandelate racemase/muconate lactonizing enzyme family protein [Marinactinospora thermotolerans]|uniref:L-alanine-DL-glutamate epimerase n=1 Tax=Marinactinospora thermotolerans DSM 45154 TaxID=1122192 RepID=A0A1T4K2U3_9ACTN|nr:mandelate racemase/muconate lactonizing enzyme family protein [Marinactinospora thermotolerans]SJZ36772.1 L-alanine-DL-glutamate epimerase [Marinactinospora thermotolerans DSM 45154]